MTNITKTELFVKGLALSAEFENTLAKMTTERSRSALMLHARECFTNAYNTFYYMMDECCKTEQEQTLCVEHFDKLYALAQEYEIEFLYKEAA